MWILIGAVVTASLLGSMHCVGMCGPLAIWASGAGEGGAKSRMILATGLYHAGRLVTYALAGFLAGASGRLIDFGGEALGVQLVAARLAGSLMILFGAFRLWQLGGGRSWSVSQGPSVAPKPPLVTRILIRVRPFIFRLPLAARGLVTGLLTALLPCGWLYLFALVAAGTGSVTSGPLIMVAFWVGTVPALVGLVAGTQVLAERFRRLVPLAAALLLIAGGCYTASGRGFQRLNSLADIRSSSRLAEPAIPGATGQQDQATDIATEMERLVDTPLPCCEVEFHGSDAP